MKLAAMFIVIMMLAHVVYLKRAKEKVWDPVESIRKVSKGEVEKERDGSVDKQVVYVTFRKEYVENKGLVDLCNQVGTALGKKNVLPNEFVQINKRVVGIVVTSITDIIEIKEVGAALKPILMIKSGEERIFGAHATAEEKQEMYDLISGKTKKRIKKSTKAKTDDL